MGTFQQGRPDLIKIENHQATWPGYDVYCDDNWSRGLEDCPYDLSGFPFLGVCFVLAFLYTDKHFVVVYLKSIFDVGVHYSKTHHQVVCSSLEKYHLSISHHSPNYL